ncbi:hypothetical protein ACLB2K_069101 [Fragaria x ananassa]
MAIYRLYFGMSNPSNINMYFFANNQYTNPSSIYSGHHDVVAFTVAILLTFIQIRYAAENLFQTHPITIILVLISLLAYCLSLVGFQMHMFLIRRNHDVDCDRYAGARKRCSLGMMFFGFVSVSLLAALLFPVVILWICQLVLLLPALVGLLLLLVVPLLVVVKLLRLQGQRKQILPLLPLTSTVLLRE